MRSRCCAAPKASFRPSSRRTRSRVRLKLGQELGRGAIIVVNMSGRGDKDVETAAKWFGLLGRCVMSRLADLFDACSAEGRSALIGYLPTGFPDVPTSISAMTAMVESGCDIVEVGIAYSDPGMDGPIIAAATEAALHGGVRVRDALRRSRRSARPAAEPW